MSKYEWERGTIKIPAKEWARFRTAVIKSWNARELARLERATKMHATLTAKVKGTRGKKRKEVIRQFYDLHLHYHPGDYDTLEMVVGDYGSAEIEGKPKKKDFRILPTSKDAHIDLGDASILLRNATRSVAWDVPENNHAREHARKHPVAKEFFRLLDRITWTRGSGGKIVGNDEYNRDADWEGGGGSYVTAEYSVEAQKRRAQMRSSYGSRHFGRR